RGAGTAAYTLADEADASVGEDRSSQLFRLCAWNAFALQTIADRLLATDAADDPATAGYVPRSTLTFVSACLDEVPIWIRRARVVESDPEARVAAALPARLPPWLYDEPTRQSELHGLQSAYEALQSRDEGLPLGPDASWLQIGAGWPVLDRDRVLLGLVVRVCGDRVTGEFACRRRIEHRDRGAARRADGHRLDRYGRDQALRAEERAL